MRQIAELTGNEKLVVAADAMDDIIGNIQAAEKGFEAWGGWWGAIIGGLTDLVPKIMKWANGDKFFDKGIAKLQKEIEEYSRQYEILNKTLDKKYDMSAYKKAETLNDNLKQQNRLLNLQIEAEKQKKKSDAELIQELTNQIVDNNMQIAENINSVIESTMGVNFESFADNFATILVDAFMKGEDAAKSFEKTINEMMRNIMINLAKNMLISSEFSEEFKKLEEIAGDIAKGGIEEVTRRTYRGTRSDGLPPVDEVIQEGRTVEQLQEDYLNILLGMAERIPELSEKLGEKYEAILGRLNLSGDSLNNSLSSQVKGVTEATASIVAGQMNAIRINQSTYIGYVIDVLSVLNAMKYDTSYIVGIYNHLTGLKIRRSPTDDGRWGGYNIS
jgi:hypothetical protein